MEDDGEVEEDLWNTPSTVRQGSNSTPLGTPCGSPHKNTINDYLNDLMDAALMPSTSCDIKSEPRETESNSDPMEEDLDYDDILDFDDDWS